MIPALFAQERPVPMSTAIAQRVHNFNAGPAALPAEVVEQTRAALLDLAGSGIGVAEHSHRGKEFVAVLQQTEKDCRELLGIGDEWSVMFLTGGASSQFFVVPQNFLNKGETANYIDTGVWSDKAIKEAKLFGNVHIAASSKAEGYNHIPTAFNNAPGAKYTHFTSNNTIYGSQFHALPASDAPLVCDASSDFMCRPVDLKNVGLVYAGAQKNLGPAGCTLVIARKDFIETGRKDIPSMLQYRLHAANESCYNTPPTLTIFMMGLVFQWLKRQGGLAGIQKQNEAKAALLYGYLDSSAFWRAPVRKDSRSLMNVVFRLATEELEEKCAKEATKAGLAGIKGHRSAGGMRASIYNAVSMDSVQALVDFLKEFERKNG